MNSKLGERENQASKVVNVDEMLKIYIGGIRQALEPMKKGRAGGEDKILIEMFQ